MTSSMPHAHLLQDGTEITDGASLFSFYDEDVNDTNLNTYERYFYSLDCDNVTNTQRFYINTETGAIQYRGDYDLDTAGTPTQLECTVTITDYYGLYDTADLYIYIKNVNEFSPEFTHTSYTFYLASNTLVGTYLTTVSAVDYDSSDDEDDEITFTVSDAMFAVNNDGALYTADTLSSDVTFEIYASNYGEADKTGTSTVTVVILSTTTTTTTTTDRNKGIHSMISKKVVILYAYIFTYVELFAGEWVGNTNTSIKCIKFTLVFTGFRLCTND